MNTYPGNLELWTKWDQLLQNVERSPEGLLALLEPSGQMSYANEWALEGDHFVFFKGSFNPIHNGHVSLFNTARGKQSKSNGAFALSFHTFKETLARADLIFRSRLIHLAGFPVIVSRSGRFSQIAASFRELWPTIQVVFPIGIDVLRRLLDYYELSEFERLFQNATFEYFRREGFDGELPPQLSTYSRISFLGDNPYLSINSTKLRQLRSDGADDEVRALMPAAAADYFLSTESAKQDMAEDDASTSASWPFIPGKKTFEVVRAEGSYLYLRDGRRVLDAAGGGGVVNVGHGRAEVVNAISKTLSNLSYAVPGFATPERLALIEHLQQHW